VSLPQFVEEFHFKRFGKTVPDTVLSVKERCRLKAAKKVGQTRCQAAAFYSWAGC
jgi:hypothetical protein